jgi:hypothetical protein
MRRRALLAAAGAGAVGALAGCTALEDQVKEMNAEDLAECLDRERGDGYAAGAATERGVSMGLRNESDGEWTATVQVGLDGETVVEETVTVGEADFSILTDGGITTTGDYDIAVAVEDGESTEGTWRVCRESFVLVVLIEDDGAVRFRKPGQRYEEDG